MSVLDALRHRVHTLLHPGVHARELEREMRFHLELEAAQQRHEGETPTDAAFTAHRQFGNITSAAERTRRAAGLAWLDVVQQDVTWAVRSIRRSPGFTLLATVTLALGVGATTAVFSVIEGVLVRPLSIVRPERVLSLRLVPTKGSAEDRQHALPSSLPQYLRWRDRLRSFSAIAALTPASPTPLGRRTARERGARFEPDTNSVRRTHVSANFFSFAGAKPLLGRGFTAADDQAASERTAVLAYGYWQRAYGGDPRAVGRTLVLDGDTYTIVGVMPREFLFPEETELWTPIGPSLGSFATNERTFMLDVLGRLREDATPEAARAELSATTANDARTQAFLRDFAVTAPLVRDRLLATIQGPLLILMAFVGAVLLIAAANVTNMLLARGTTRQHELAIRLALGAGRGRIVRQLLTESLMLATGSAIVGALAAVPIVRFIVAQPALDLPRRSLIGMNPLVLAACAITAILVGLVCGLVPALSLSGDAIESALRRDAMQQSASRGRRRLRDALVVAEVALAVVLLAGAGLLRKSFLGLMELRPGLSADGVLTADLRLGVPTADAGARSAMAAAIAERLRATPGIAAATVTSSYPFGGAMRFATLTLPGIALDSATHPFTMLTGVDADYFRTFGTHVLRGRAFGPADLARRDVAIINDAAARKYFGDLDPVGRHVGVSGMGELSLEVVGVVESTRQAGLKVDYFEPVTYVPLAAEGANNLAVVVRMDHGDPTQLVPAVERTVKEAAPTAQLRHLAPLAANLEHVAARPRVYEILLGGFALVAMALTAIGLYGVVSYSVAQRTREIGIRIALGASPRRLRQHVVWQGLALTLAGVTIGGGLALAATRILRSILYGLSPNDPAVLGAVAALLTTVAVLACWVPARRAAKVDPMVAMRAD